MSPTITNEETFDKEKIKELYNDIKNNYNKYKKILELIFKQYKKNDIKYNFIKNSNININELKENTKRRLKFYNYLSKYKNIDDLIKAATIAPSILKGLDGYKCFLEIQKYIYLNLKSIDKFMYLYKLQYKYLEDLAINNNIVEYFGNNDDLNESDIIVAFKAFVLELQIGYLIKNNYKDELIKFYQSLNNASNNTSNSNLSNLNLTKEAADEKIKYLKEIYAI